MKNYTWKDVVLVNGKVTCEEFPISGEKDGDKEDDMYCIDDFLEAVAKKYGVDVDEVKTYMMDDIDFNPRELGLEFGAEDCGCYIDGVAEWLIDEEDDEEKEFTVEIVLNNDDVRALEKKFGAINDSSDAYDAVMEAITTYLEL